MYSIAMMFKDISRRRSWLSQVLQSRHLERMWFVSTSTLEKFLGKHVGVVGLQGTFLAGASCSAYFVIMR